MCQLLKHEDVVLRAGLLFGRKPPAAPLTGRRRDAQEAIVLGERVLVQDSAIYASAADVTGLSRL